MNENADYGRFIAEYGKIVPRLRAFLRMLLPSWHDVDEVLQETSLVLWKKFDQYEDGTSFFAWSSMVARFEVLKYRRKKSRDRHVFSDELLEMLADECMEREEDLSHKRKVLKTCVTKLDERQQSLLMASYSREITIKELAEREGKSPGSLYKVLDRLRQRLVKCVNEQEGLAYE
jgi:RNA polymerase sigma-70 factor (ECF subfamily)